jgi:hypothetical protein
VLGTWSAEVSITYPKTKEPPSEEPPNEEPPNEEPPGEEPPGEPAGGVVNAVPTGPAAPSGGWHVAFADGFGAPIGTGPGQDNFWYPNEGSCCTATEDKNGNNTNELQVYNSSQVKVGSEGLELVDTFSPNRKKAEGSYPVRNYVSGAVQTFSRYVPGGYRPFTWEPNQGEKWAFECDCKLPVNTGEVDPGWWAMDAPWHNELDFFEEWGWACESNVNCLTGITWIYNTAGLQLVQSYKSLYTMFDPSAAYHRYTTVINPNNSIEEYIDGVRQTWLGNNGVLGPPPGMTAAKMAIILTNALREKTPLGPNPATHFQSGSRTFAVRSIGVYQDAGHAGQNVEGGGVAPGTTVR